ncbi:dipeptidase [Candidatus Villigracilis affinis]|jgi:acetylornithine deacetylase/succinyl-diaminopimelate desuccinylase-like protein|uniref:dipeptidase n=1 Tax=Candidatus Villigracilis affinis TaxID=3140682 RepID=UPI001B5AF14E|nr:dipeptidase [Anaerolineales bacterium]MBL0347724.1 dipeptidase [Anaerolineales bacterium]MBP8047374.1 dipeptidase [Anaerolineales bacterium]
MSDAQKAIEYAHQNRERFSRELTEFIRIESVSTDDEYKPQVLKAAEWAADHLRKIGIENVALMPTGGHPVVYGDWLKRPGAPTVLIYGHYDVQPVDPIELWETSPFEATVKGDYLFGRGTSDMKGQVMATLNAVESIMKTGDFPVNLKFMLEGEEEIGSMNMGNFLPKHKDLFKADFCLNPDAGAISADEPTITFGLRGLAYFEVHVYGPTRDLHSGLFGGTVHNPAQALAELIAGMHDSNGTITLPGFYDSVRPVTDQEREATAKLPTTPESYLKQTEVPALWGEKEYTPALRTGARPTLEVNGLLSGWTGPGSKTVLPAKAMAKISCRLVPDQDPIEVHKQLVRYMEEHAPKTVTWEVKNLHDSPWAITDVNTNGVRAMAAAMETIWGKPPLYRREGGSIGVVAMLQNICGVESGLVGGGLPDDNVHSPNERMHLPTWHKNMDAFIHFFFNMK